MQIDSNSDIFAWGMFCGIKKIIFLLICIKLFNIFTIHIWITIFILIFSIFTLLLYVSLCLFRFNYYWCWFFSDFFLPCTVYLVFYISVSKLKKSWPLIRFCLQRECFCYLLYCSSKFSLCFFFLASNFCMEKVWIMM